MHNGIILYYILHNHIIIITIDLYNIIKTIKDTIDLVHKFNNHIPK